ncbi:MAG: cupredoxin domain-containing protein [Chromatiales bacterium]
MTPFCAEVTMQYQRDVLSKAGARILLALLFFSMASARAQESQPAGGAAVTAETGADGVQRLLVTLESYTFTPAHIVVQSGKPVELTLKNIASLAPHSFKLDSAAAGLYVTKKVKPGEMATVQFTPTKAGMFDFYCDKKLAFLPSHRDKGMIGKLEVR